MAQRQSQRQSQQTVNYLAVLDKKLPPEPKLNTFHPSEIMSILVGPRKHPFQVNRRLLCDAVPFFRQKLEDPSFDQSRPVLWLPGESSAMFGLFIEWIHDRRSFRYFLDSKVVETTQIGIRAVRDLQWAMIRLHLFASHLNLYHLQDLSMDSIQDLFLKCDWEVSPKFIMYIYTKCEALPSVRLRRWSVAMTAYAITGSCRGVSNSKSQDLSALDTAKFYHLFDILPEFALDYKMHVRNMRASRLDIRFKNPQLRIPANKLHNEERIFGFRQCSFHSHRSIVGEGPCPHDLDSGVRRRSSVFDDDNSSLYGGYDDDDALTTALSPPVTTYSAIGSEDGRPWLSPGGSIPGTLDSWASRPLL